MNFVSIGAGNIGRAWAILFALKGGSVRLYDTTPSALDSAMGQIMASLGALSQAGMLTENADTVVSRITPVLCLKEAVSHADYVQESIAEIASEKACLFQKIDEHAPASCILASSTSGLVGSRFLEHVKGRHRCLVVHPVNPPYLIPLVELCPTQWTSADVITTAQVIMVGLGQSPVLLKKEVNGFILNRLQVALLAEALHLVGEDYCSVDEVDKCIKYGLGLRWAFMGPFETGHLNAHGGYLEYMTKFSNFFHEIAQDLRPNYEWGPGLINRIDAECQKTIPSNKIKDIQVWRDSMVMGLLKHFSQCE